MAAARAGVHTVVLPRRNQKDVVEIPAEVLEKLELRFVETLEEVLAIALEPPAAA
jgi:ATP-dependent Lon protease